jgi:hypothetical protein
VIARTRGSVIVGSGDGDLAVVLGLHSDEGVVSRRVHGLVLRRHGRTDGRTSTPAGTHPDREECEGDHDDHCAADHQEIRGKVRHGTSL